MNQKAIRTSILMVFLVITFCLLPISTVSAAETEGQADTEEQAGTEEVDGWPKGPTIDAEAAIVMDAATGAILYEKNIDAQYYPASITKIMTVLLVLEHASLDAVVTFSETAVTNLEVDSSHIGIRAGEKLTIRQCLYAIMLASANEVSNGVAEHVAGSIEEFANMMNEKAAELGCQQTHFTNPHGLHNKDHYTTAYDMALITQAAMEQPLFLEFASALEYIIPVTNLVAEERSFLNHHKMVLPNTEYSYDACVGGKTGFTNDALNTLTTISSKDGMDLICVILKINGAAESYKATIELLDYCYDNFSSFTITEHDELFKEITTLGTFPGISAESTGLFQISSDASLIMPKDLSFGNLSKTISFNTEEEDADPVISYFYKEKFLGDVSISLPPEEDRFLDLTELLAETMAVNTEEIRESESPLQNSVEPQTALEIETAEGQHRDETTAMSILAEHFYLIMIAILLILFIILIYIIIMLAVNHSKKKHRKKKMSEKAEDDNAE